MKKSQIALIALIFIFALSVSISADAALYNTIWDASGGQISLTDWDAEMDYIRTDNYSVHEVWFTFTNTSSSTFPNVKFVVPFTWGHNDNGWFAYDWTNGSQEWQNDSWQGNDDDTIYLWIKVNDVPLTPSATASPDSFILVSQTDTPLSSSYSSVTATVQSSDSLPAWNISSSFAPDDVVTIYTYFQQERDANNGLNALRFDAYVVATPIPTSVLLLTSGLLGLVTIRRRLKR